MHLPTIHFYDAKFIGTPAMGQLVSFDSLVCSSEQTEHYAVQITLRPDAVFNPESIEQMDVFDMDLSTGISEYQWSRRAQALFERPGTLHIGVGNTHSIDNYIRFALYRCLSTLPNTELPQGAHYLDLLTICRVFSLLRPEHMRIELKADWSELRRRDYLFTVMESDSRAHSIVDLARDLATANPKLFAYAIAHSSPHQIARECGLVDGRVESLASLKPVFVCHESLMAPQKFGCYLALGTDPQYPKSLIYMIDLQADLTALIEDAGMEVNRFIRTSIDQFDRPIIRVNLNRIPFVSPVSVIDQARAKSLQIDLDRIKHNTRLLQEQLDLCLALMEISGASDASINGDPDFQLYGAEYPGSDRALLTSLHAAPAEDWRSLLSKANDARITALGNRLIRRCSPALLGEDETKKWRAHCANRLLGRADPNWITATRDYCLGIANSTEYPKGMRAAAHHWLHTTEIGNDPSSNFRPL